jgi:hypothetical protein
MVLEAAERGEVEIVVSALTLAEVLWMKNSPRLPAEERQRIRDFFKREYILVVDVNRRVAEMAQDVVWKHSVKPKDAVHVASALLARAEYLDTFDGELIKLSGKVGGNPLLHMGHPGVTTQQDLFQGPRPP